MKRAALYAVAACTIFGCAAPKPPVSQGAPSAKARASAPVVTDTETFEQRLRRRANQALGDVGATPDQKTEIDEMLIFNSKTLYDCVGGSERRLAKTLSILASSENQGQALAALEAADIPLSGLCVMLGSDLITQFSETLTEPQRRALAEQWRSMKNEE